MNKKLLKDVEHLLDKAEESIWDKSSDVMLRLYWELGYVLSEYSVLELTNVSKELGLILGVEDKMFEVAYHFYKENPILEKAVSVAR
ncbi:MAG: hypothetical protein Q8Q35_00430 [Nanoarchaeota archaeon]|nr:hypothetical protein [Nanoarchaeota archaeon]